MANTYDLLLQPMTQGAPFDEAAVRDALMASGAVVDPDGSLTLRLPAARADLALRWVREGGVAQALDCRIPLSDQTDLVDAALRWALDFAPQKGLQVMDPQLNSTITAAGGAVLDEFLRAARYAGEYTGVSDAVAASRLADEPGGTSASTRVLMALVVFFAALYATFSVVTRQSDRPRPAVDRGPGATLRALQDAQRERAAQKPAPEPGR